MIDKETVLQALEPYVAGFESDGSKMEQVEINGNEVYVKIVVYPGGCRECILPADYLQDMFKESMGDAGIDDVQVRVEIEDRS
ncbi:MAG: hypothetical protein SOR75_00155 [Synergistes jonesii]|uniref:hypothetical protein n=1 Tax=Synergistes jonesii TaxID=2754 RepID=UPI002A763543|nr:hypothetical protein [Synergistes jonesii]MDY2983727.1 hypothetical protein [Synergistes jonesii]